MGVNKRALIIVGSMKGREGASESIANYLSMKLSVKHFLTKKICVGSIFESEKLQYDFFSTLEKSDVLIFVSPLYVDSPPYLVSRLMEVIIEHQKEHSYDRKPQLLVISNCGYPESEHNKVALSIYRKFSSETRFHWAGGLALGMGLAFQHNGMQKLSLIFPRFRNAFEMVADLLAEGRPILDSLEKKLGEKFIPIWLYNVLLGIGIIFITAKNGVRKIDAKPYVFTPRKRAIYDK